MSKIWTKRRHLPRIGTYTPRPEDPTLFRLANQRESIVQTVTERVVARHSNNEAGLETTLNDAAYHETKRLQVQRDDEAKDNLAFWSGLYRRIARMGHTEKVQALGKIAERYTYDVAGNFDPRVYGFAKKVAPRLITGVMSPSSLPAELALGESALRNLVRTTGPIEHLRQLAKKGTLVFVPTHSSNLDSVVLAHALAQDDLPPLVYGAGKNLFTNPFLSFFMHNLGAYRVDRRIESKIYKDVLKTFSCVMIEEGFHSLFFPGGTRSRSNLIESKLKLGLAGSAVEAFARNQVNGKPKPVWFVPTTINYELVLEAETLIEDHLKERGQARYIIEDDEFSRLERWIAFFRKIVSLSSACIIRFGEPIDPFGNPVDDRGNSQSPTGQSIDPGTYVWSRGKPELNEARDRAYTQELANVLVERYPRDTHVMTTQLVAHVLYRNLVRQTPGADLFARIRERGTVSMDQRQLDQEVGEARDALLALRDSGGVHLAETMERTDPARLVDRAISSWNGYHTRTAAVRRGTDVVLEDPTLLYYYQNRVVPFAEAIADPDNLRAAREIEQGA